jgi:hypothetical protein
MKPVIDWAISPIRAATSSYGSSTPGRNRLRNTVTIVTLRVWHDHRAHARDVRTERSLTARHTLSGGRFNPRGRQRRCSVQSGQGARETGCAPR